MPDNHNETIPIPTTKEQEEEELAHLKSEVVRSRFWADFMAEVEKIPLEALDDFQKTMQAHDDEARAKVGLAPRAWEEIAGEMEEECDALLLEGEEGLEEEENEEGEGMGMGMGVIADQIQQVVMRYDGQKRRENGLEPRSWREFMEEFEEAVGVLMEGGGEGSALEKMASLSLGKGSGEDK
ncbi:MAG: hypothetical protein Q9186_003275 [Xanthomendoza sp. 1 TL-2023]